ncbi:MAG: DUF808 domain-containing protein [Steroidobacteraceae bacterium]
MPSSLLALLDDITSLLDDMGTMTKVATQKTAGVLGDDLALNAQQVSGVSAERELPIVWAVAKGSLVNKAILVPAALLLSAFAPWAITPLLVAGGLFLCYEGAEKIAHHLWGVDDPAEVAHRSELAAAVADPEADLLAVEGTRIKGAIRTDFILSAEIIVIALGTVAAAPPLLRTLVLVGIALLMTVGVYGLVAGIVKLDDAGLALLRTGSRAAHAVGRGILRAAPWLMQGLSIAGTAAMFLVGGGILGHGIGFLHHGHAAAQAAAGGAGGLIYNAAIGMAAGFIVVLVVQALAQLRSGPRGA